MLPPITRLLRSGADHLEELCLDASEYCNAERMVGDGHELHLFGAWEDESDAAHDAMERDVYKFCEALKAARSLKKVAFIRLDVWRHPEQFGDVLGALTGHATVQEIDISGNDLWAVGDRALQSVKEAEEALEKLVSAENAALRVLRIGDILPDRNERWRLVRRLEAVKQPRVTICG